MATDDELVLFVRESLARGLTRGDIESALKSAGWSVDQIGGSLGSFANVDFPVPVPRPRPSLSAREAFVYLLLFTTLYIVAFSVGNVLFEVINRAFPDPADLRPGTSLGEAVRWSLSSLIVAFPLFLYMSATAARAIARDPVKRGSQVRRWLTYLTLFVAACFLIGDSVTLVYNLLGGELTVRFVLKVIVVAAIAGSVFGYYLSELRVDEKVAAA